MDKNSIKSYVEIISELDDGWYTENSKAPSLKTLKTLRKFMAEYTDYEKWLTEIKPTEQGQIILTYKKGDLVGSNLDVQFDDNGIEYILGKQKTKNLTLEQYLNG